MPIEINHPNTIGFHNYEKIVTIKGYWKLLSNLAPSVKIIHFQALGQFDALVFFGVHRILELKV
jgi:hypothetical protein